MGLFDEQNSEENGSEEPKPTDYTYAVMLAVVIVVFFVFRHIGKEDLGLNVGISLAMCILAIRIRWDLRMRLWFWMVVGFVLALHIPLFLWVQWPHTWVPGIALLPVGLADLLLILGAVRLVENFILKAPPPED